MIIRRKKPGTDEHFPNHEQLVVEIYVTGNYIGLISKEKGPDQPMFEIGPQPQDGEQIRIVR